MLFESMPGRNYVDRNVVPSRQEHDACQRLVRSHRGAVSIHWGDNWGYDVPPRQVGFAHRLIEGGIDLVHGHSSHHPRPIEVYRERLILYGCGDFIDDYEGITGHQQYRDDLVLMFFPSLDCATGHVIAMEMTPMQIRNLRLNRPSVEDTRWLCATLNRISRPFDIGCTLTGEGRMRLDRMTR